MSSGFAPGLVDPRLIFPNLAGRTLDEVLLEMAEDLAAARIIRDPVELAQRLRKRESDGCTGLGGGIALPHCRVHGLKDVVLAVGISAAGVDFGAPDGIPITLIFLLLSPQDAPARHLQALARLSRLVRAPGLAAELRRAGSREEVVRVLKEAEAAASAAATA